MRKTINFCVADTWTILALMLRSLKQINGLPLHQLHQPSESKLFILLTPTEILCEKGSEISKKTRDCSGGEQLKLIPKKNPVKVSSLLLPEETRDCYFIFAKTHKKKQSCCSRTRPTKRGPLFLIPKQTLWKNSVVEEGIALLLPTKKNSFNKSSGLDCMKRAATEFYCSQNFL